MISCRINSRLLPLKFHYLLAYGGFAAMIPFLPVVAKEIGISATALGIAYSMTPFFAFLFNPIIGFLVDYFQNIKIFYIVLLTFSTVAYGSIFSLPTISRNPVNTTYIQVNYFNESESLLNISETFERTCLENTLRNPTECKLVFDNEIELMYNNESSNFGSFINITYNRNTIGHGNRVEGRSHWINFFSKNISLFETENIMNSLSIQCSPSIQHCSIDETYDVFSSYQFWAFLILIVLGSTTCSSGDSLRCLACYELLGTNPEAYGRQRLFGTVAWGLVSPLSGLLNDHLERGVIFIIFLVVIFRIIDTIILCFIPIPKAHASSDMCKDLRIIFTSKEILVFSCGIALTGFLSAIISGFEFWFLEDLGATRTLLGLTIVVQCLVGEVPFLYISGWIVRKLGHFLSFSCVFAAFLFRLVSYYLLKDPWFVLAIDISHGVTFGLYHVAMTSFANEKAPKGMEATMLGLFNGLRSGLGYGLGSFLGGIGLDKLGSRQTFFSACMLSLGCLLFFLFGSYIFRKRPKVKIIEQVSLETEEKLISA